MFLLRLLLARLKSHTSVLRLHQKKKKKKPVLVSAPLRTAHFASGSRNWYLIIDKRQIRYEKRPPERNRVGYLHPHRVCIKTEQQLAEANFRWSQRLLNKCRCLASWEVLEFCVCRSAGGNLSYLQKGEQQDTAASWRRKVSCGTWETPQPELLRKEAQGLKAESTVPREDLLEGSRLSPAQEIGSYFTSSRNPPS